MLLAFDGGIETTLGFQNSKIEVGILENNVFSRTPSYDDNHSETLICDIV